VRPVACLVAENSHAVPGCGAPTVFTTPAPAAWVTDGLASACGDRQTAAARPASAGAAAAGSRRLSRGRDDLLWQPKGLLSVQFALTGKAAA
jgi:hypothetical protein